MIQSRADLKEYLDADYLVIQNLGKRFACENTVKKLRGRLYYHLQNKMRVYTGVSIKPNNFGKGLGLFHTGPIVVKTTARFSDWCVILNNVNVAAKVRGGA